MNTPPPGNSKSELMAFLRRLNATIGEKAATMSWWRIFGLILIVVIVSQMIRDILDLRHDKEPTVAVTRTAKEGNEKAGKSHDCEGDEIRIGGKNGGIVICDGKRVKKSAPAQQTAPAAPASPATSATPGVPPEPGSPPENGAGQ